MLRRFFGSQDSEEPGLTRRDKETFDEFRELGTDFSRSRRIDHVFVLRSEDAARALADQLSPPLEVMVDHVGGSWSVQASLTMPLSVGLIEKTRPRFEALAKEFGGRYDGWGAEADTPG